MFIYKPIKQYMIPNETTIDPAKPNIFSLIIGGQLCTAYRFRVFDLNNNLISSVSTGKTQTYIIYNIVGVNPNQDTITINSNRPENGDAIRFYADGTLPPPIVAGQTYYIGNFNLGTFNIYTSRANAIADQNRINITDTGGGLRSVYFDTPLYNGDTLEIIVNSGLLEPGNIYKWQIDLYAQDQQVTSVSTSANTITVPNHNLQTGSTIFITASSYPGGTSAFTQYFVRRINANTLALFTNIEGARNDAGRISITSSGSNVYINNVATSEEVVFYVYDSPVVEFPAGIINQQQFTFTPVYVHPQLVMIESFTAYLRAQSNPETIISSGLQENIRLEWTFDGLINGQTYNVRFVITNQVKQVYDTGWVSFLAQYDTADIGFNPTASNNEPTASVLLEWPETTQIIGDVVGSVEFLDNFGVAGNTALQMNPSSTLTFNGLNIRPGSSPPMFFWSPQSADFRGIIMRCDNTQLPNEYIEVGYSGAAFYRVINGRKFSNATMQINPNMIYMIGFTYEELIVTVLGTRN